MPAYDLNDLLDFTADIEREIADQWIANGHDYPSRSDLLQMRDSMHYRPNRDTCLAAWLDSKPLVVDLTTRTIKIECTA